MKLVKALLWIAGIFAVVAGVLRATIFDVWVIPDDDAYFAASVAPSLLPGDVVLLATRGNRSLGDLVRCPDPQVGGKWVVGRILGEPNDRVHIDDRGVQINNRSIPTALACPPHKMNDPQTGNEVTLPCGVEDYAGRRYMRVTSPSADVRNAAVDTTITGTGQAYLISDNRYYHNDSRDFGLVPKSTCDGRIVFRLWGASGWMDADRRLTFIE
jgi:signal peptidase I